MMKTNCGEIPIHKDGDSEIRGGGGGGGLIRHRRKQGNEYYTDGTATCDHAIFGYRVLPESHCRLCRS